MISALIVAGGKGTRMAADRPKQFLALDDRPIIMHTLHAFDRCTIVEHAIAVFPEHEIPFVESELLPKAGFRLQWKLVSGGATRQASVKHGLDAIAEDGGIVLIHDGVRPLVSEQLIRAVAEGARQWGACIPAIASPDTIKQVDESGLIVATPQRNTMRLAQTPQGFQVDLIKKAHAAARETVVTDDAAMVEAIGGTVRTIAGDRNNIKITNPEDLEIASIYFKRTTP